MKLVSCFSFILILLLGSCKKQGSTEQFVPYPTEDTVWGATASSFIHPLDTLFNSSYTQTWVANTAAADTLHFNSYADVICPAGFATNSGSVNVSLLYLKTKGDFVRFARPTFSETDGLLENTAAFKVSITQNNQSVSIAPGNSIKLHFRIGAPFNAANEVINGDTTVSNTGNFTWSLNTGNSLLQPFTYTDNTGTYPGYDITCNQTGWIGCGRAADNNATATGKIVVLLPPNFTNKNASVYIVSRSQRSVIRLTPEISSKSFRSAYIPVNSDVTIVALGKSNGNYYAEAANFSTGSWQLLKVKPHKCSKQQISDLLDAL